ncbi:MAG: riboflavin synthase [Treponema sp.]|nr:riboflavin synthase [Treponema sp.]
MFTGIVEEVGTVSAITHVSGRARLVIQAEKVLEQTKYGDSINVEGACQTVAELSANTFTVFTLAESLKKTTLGLLRAGSKVNLERAMLPTTRMGGHMVQGHVSAAVPIRELSKTANNVYLAVEVPEELLRLCVPEGSVALDGISLTIAKISGSIITVNVIPVTIEDTTLKYKKPGDKMNLETDIIGRYVERYLAPFIAQAKNKETNGLSIERMLELGY